MTFLQQLNIFTGMAMVMVIPLDKFLHPDARIIQARKAFRGPARMVFHRPEQRLRVRVIVTDPRATVGAHHTEFLQLGPQHHAFHRTAIVRV